MTDISDDNRDKLDLARKISLDRQPERNISLDELNISLAKSFPMLHNASPDVTPKVTTQPGKPRPDQLVQERGELQEVGQDVVNVLKEIFGSLTDCVQRDIMWDAAKVLGIYLV